MRFKDLKVSYYKGKPPKIKEGSFLLPYLTPDYIRIGAVPEFFPLQAGVVLVENNELILLWDGSNAGEFFRGKKGILSSTMVKFDKIEGADDDYIFYSLKLQEPILKSKTSGSGIPHVDKDALFNLEIFLPAIEQQTIIATLLTTIDQAIEKTEQLIAKYERIKTGLMQDLLIRGIDANGNIRSEETHVFKDSVVGRVPKEWEVGGIGNFCFVTKLAGFEFTNYLRYIEDGEIIALRALNIKNEKLDLTNVQRISKKVSDFLTRSKLYAGDVLITYIGAYIGDIVQIRENNKYHLAPNIAKIVPPDYIINDFLEIYLRSYSVQRQMKNATATTATPSLTMRQIRNLNIAFPKDKNEQKRIVDSINTVNSKIRNNEENFANLKRIKTALMQDLLTGKVSVDALINQMNESIYPIQ